MPEMLTSLDVLSKTKPTADNRTKTSVAVALPQPTVVLATTDKSTQLQRSNENTHTGQQEESGGSAQRERSDSGLNAEVRNGTQALGNTIKALPSAPSEAKEKTARFGRSMARMEGKSGRGKVHGQMPLSGSSAARQTSIVTDSQPGKNLYFSNPPTSGHPAEAKQVSIASQTSGSSPLAQGPTTSGHQDAPHESRAMDPPPAKRLCVDAGLHQPVPTGPPKPGSTLPLSTCAQKLPTLRAKTAKSAAIPQQQEYLANRVSSLTGNGAALPHGNSAAVVDARTLDSSRVSSHSSAERDLLGAIGLGAISPRPGSVLPKAACSATATLNRQGGERADESQQREHQPPQPHPSTSFDTIRESTRASGSGDMTAVVSQMADALDPGVTLGVPYTQAIATAQGMLSVFSDKAGTAHTSRVETGSNAGTAMGVIATGVPVWSLHGESTPVRVAANSKAHSHVPYAATDGSQSGLQQALTVGSQAPGEGRSSGEAGTSLDQQHTSAESAGPLTAPSSRQGIGQQGAIPLYSHSLGPAATDGVSVAPAADSSLDGVSGGTVNRGPVIYGGKLTAVPTPALLQAQPPHEQQCVEEDKSSPWGLQQQPAQVGYQTLHEGSVPQNGGNPFGSFLCKDAEEGGAGTVDFTHNDEAPALDAAGIPAFPAASGPASVTPVDSASAAAYSRYFEGMRMDGQMESPLTMLPSAELKPLDVPWPGGSLAMDSSRGTSSMQLWQGGEMLGHDGDDRKDRKKDRHRKASGGRNPMIRLNPTTADRFFAVQRLLEARRGKRTSGSFVVNWLMDVCRPGIQGVVSDEGGLIVDGEGMRQLEEGEDKGSMGSSSGGEDEEEEGLRGQDDGGGCYEEHALVQSYMFPSQR